MRQVPAGWYADPAQGELDGPTERYWDGAAWSHQVRRSQSSGSAAHGDLYPDAPYEVDSIPSTPDGQVLAGWWIRAGAFVLDWVIVTPLLVLVALPSLVTHWDSISSWWNAGYSPNGTLRNDPVPTPAVLDPTTGPGLVLFALLSATCIVYAMVFLRWKQATPGKLVAGLRVRKRSAPGPLGWSTIVRRVGFVAVIAIGTWVPTVGVAFLVLAAIDYLWPLWDANRQALHDKFAGTNVVLTPVESANPSPQPPPVDSGFKPLTATTLGGTTPESDDS